jgi:hypothetical protein
MDAARTNRHGDGMSQNSVPGRDEAAVKPNALAGTAGGLVHVANENPSAESQPDRVDAAGLASFPASDPPSWWGGS